MSALNDLRENLRAAARRDIAAQQARKRRVRRRATGFLAIALLGGAAAAGAADLISVGEPVKDTRRGMAGFRPANPAGVTLAVTARSGGELPFGVGIYEARNGKRCAIAGEVRGSSLGRIAGETFRPYDRVSQLGVCNGWSTLDIGDRTLLFGRAAPDKRVVRVNGKTQPVGPGGAFLFVYERVPMNEGFDVDYR